MSKQQPPPHISDSTSSKLDRQLQWRVTLVGVVGALFGAAIGGGATLLGTLVQQHSQDASQLRAERESSYISYNSAMDSFAGDVTAVVLDAEIGLSPTKWLGTLISTNAQLGHFADRVIILGSPRLRQIVEAQQKSAETLDLEAQALAFRETDPNAPVSEAVPAKSTLIAELLSGDKSFTRVENAYENIARTDLATN